MKAEVQVLEVSTKRMLRDFIRFPHDLYRDDKHYVPMPNLLVKKLLNPDRNPFFRNGDVSCFLALNNHGRIQGRIAAVYNKVHLSVYKDDAGFFGFFDCVDDKTVAELLFNRVGKWHKEKGLSKMMGPENLTTNDPTGVLTKGFETPVFLMPYNFPYYENLFRMNGFTDAMTLYSYRLSLHTLPPDIHDKAGSLEKRLKQHNIILRYFDGNNFSGEMKRLNAVYNSVNEQNWGFMPLDKDSFMYMAKELKQVVDKESVLFVEKDGMLVGFAVSVPDYNQVFKYMPNGKLFPIGWWHLLTGRKRIKQLRIIILGVLPEWRGLGIDWCLYAKIAAYAKDKGFETAEACYVMQNNKAMIKMMNALSATVVKEYRLFERAI